MWRYTRLKTEKADGCSSVKNENGSLWEMFKLCMFSHLQTSGQSLCKVSEIVDCLFQISETDAVNFAIKKGCFKRYETTPQALCLKHISSSAHGVSHALIYLWRPAMIKTSAVTNSVSIFGAGQFIKSTVEIYKPLGYLYHCTVGAESALRVEKEQQNSRHIQSDT